jgi:hypothetical protein
MEVIKVYEVLVKNTGAETWWVREQDFRMALNWALGRRIGLIWLEYNQKADSESTLMNIKVPRKQKTSWLAEKGSSARTNQDCMELTIIYVDGRADG